MLAASAGLSSGRPPPPLTLGPNGRGQQVGAGVVRLWEL